MPESLSADREQSLTTPVVLWYHAGTAMVYSPRRPRGSSERSCPLCGHPLRTGSINRNNYGFAPPAEKWILECLVLGRGVFSLRTASGLGRPRSSFLAIGFPSGERGKGRRARWGCLM